MPEPREEGAIGPTVAVIALSPFLRFVESQGSEVAALMRERGEALLARANVSVPELESNHALRLPASMLFDLLDMLVDVLGDPAAPFKAGRCLQLGDYELLEYLCGSCADLGSAMACLGRYYRLLIDAEFEVVTHDDCAETRFRIDDALRAPNVVNEFALASNLTMAMLHIDPVGLLPPRKIHFRHPEPAHSQVIRETFYVPVLFDQPHDSIFFELPTLRQPLHTADPVLHEVLLRAADVELAALPRLSAFPRQVCDLLEHHLPAGPTLESIADELGMAPSTLRARLQTHGTTFSRLLEDTRRHRARVLLMNPDLNFGDVAHSLGFSHSPAFNRAFRRWYGCAPSEYRSATRASVTARFFSGR